MLNEGGALPEAFGGDEAGDIDASVLDQSRKDYRARMLVGRISRFDFLVYSFGRQVESEKNKDERRMIVLFFWFFSFIRINFFLPCF